MQQRESANPTQAAGTSRIENAERLAKELIRHLGVAGATRTCLENHWDGVLSAVEAQARTRSVV